MKTIISGTTPLASPVPVRANNHSPLQNNDPPLPARNRRSVRLRGYDYSQAGAYFITICTQNRHCLFGHITEGAMVLNDAGRVVADCWLQIPDHFPNVELDEWVVMPNHIHGIVIIVGANHHSIVRANNHSPLQKHPTGTARTIGSIVRGFKIGVTQWYRQRSVASKIWQRNYWDHIIRNESELNRIRQYILDNPMQWEQDSLHAPTAVGANDNSPLPDPRARQTPRSHGRMNETRHIEWKQSLRDPFSKGDLQRFSHVQLREIAREKDWDQVLVRDRLRYNDFMSLKTFAPNLNSSRRPSKLGDQLAKHKIDEARKLTPEQRLLLALELSDAAAALQRACSNKR